MKAETCYWNDEDCFLCFFGDVHKEQNLTIAREAEYHQVEDRVVVVDVFWDDNEDMTECHSINPDTLKYYEEECTVQPSLTRKEYEEIVEYVKQKANEN